MTLAIPSILWRDNFSSPFKPFRPGKSDAVNNNTQMERFLDVTLNVDSASLIADLINEEV